MASSMKSVSIFLIVIVMAGIFATMIIAPYTSAALPELAEVSISSGVETTLVLPPVARNIPPLSPEHHAGRNSPDVNVDAAARAISAQTLFPEVVQMPNPNWNLPPTLDDKVRCIAVVIGGEVVRFGLFETVKVSSAGTIYGNLSFWSPEGGWITAMKEARWTKEVITPPQELQDWARENGKGSVVNEIIDCIAMGNFPPPGGLQMAP